MICPVCQGSIPDACPNPTACMEYDRQRRADEAAAAEGEHLAEMEAQHREEQQIGNGALRHSTYGRRA